MGRWLNVLSVNAVPFMKVLIRILLLCGLLPATVWGQHAQSHPSGFRMLYRVYTTRDGLAQLQVRSLARDTYGQVWIGTQNGLSRFDGERIVSYGREHGLPRGTIADLAVDERQRLWGATRSELFVFDGVRTRVFAIPGDASQPSLRPLPDGGLMVRRETGLLYFRDSIFLDVDKVYPFLKRDVTYEVTVWDPASDRMAVFEEGARQIWLINADGTRRKRLAVPAGYRAHLTVSPAGTPMVDLRSEDNSLICAVGRDSLIPIMEVTPSGLAETPEQIRVRVLRRDLAPPLFPFPTRKGAGIWALETGGYRWLPECWFNTITRSLITASGRVFLATDGGLVVLDRPGWQRLEGHPCGNPWSVVPVADGDSLLVGCHRSGIQRMDRSGLGVRDAGFGGEALTDHQIFPGYASDNRGNFFFGGYRGLYHWSRQGGTRHWSAPFTIEALAWDPFRERLLGAGTALYEAGPGDSLRLVREIPATISQTVSCTDLELDRLGGIWLAGWGGVAFLQEDGHWRLYTERNGKLPFESAFTLLHDHRGRLWCGGSEGLAVLNPGDSLFRAVHPGIFRDQVSQVLMHGRDTMVVIGSKECSVLSLDQGPPRLLAYFDHRNSFDILEPAENGASIDRQGFLWLAAASGIHRLHLSALLGHAADQPRILIDQVNEYFVAQETLLHPEVRVRGDRVIVHYRIQGTLASRAKALYRLDGDHEWRPAGVNGDLLLDGLSHGRHRIELRADLPGWTQEPFLSVLTLDVDIPFFQRPGPQRLALLAGLGLLVLAMGGAYQQWRSRRVMRRLQDRIGRARLGMIQAQLNPHFLFNAMVSLQNSIRNRSRDEASDQLVRLSRLIRQVLDFSANSGKDKDAISLTPLDQELALLQDYVRMEQEQRDPGFTFILDLDPDVKDENPAVPPLLIQPFVENAILHGLSPLRRAGMIRVAISRPDARTLRYLIEDDGVGRAAASAGKTARPGERRSLGISLMEERISILGDLGLPCRLQIADRDSGGTIVEIHLTIPYADRDH